MRRDAWTLLPGRHPAVVDLDRRAFLIRAAVLALAATSEGCFGRERPTAAPGASEASGEPLMPTLFVGHGTPMNALADNEWSRGWRSLGAALPRPRAILSVSAHWFLPATLVTGDEHPETIHDFAGFPPELSSLTYPAPGSPQLARRVSSLLNDRAELNSEWGLDHGTWSVLRHLAPEATCPVIQLSIDARLEPAGHLALARGLAPLRHEGVLILGSGNLTHNLRWLRERSEAGEALETPPWAARFDAAAAEALARRDDAFLLRALDGEDGKLSHPTPDHYYPLLYALGAAMPDERPAFPITGFDLGAFSMRAAKFG
jgi:4,5-DOPA dioxygenase extradiol